MFIEIHRNGLFTCYGHLNYYMDGRQQFPHLFNESKGALFSCKLRSACENESKHRQSTWNV